MIPYSEILHRILDLEIRLQMRTQIIRASQGSEIIRSRAHQLRTILQDIINQQGLMITEDSVPEVTAVSDQEVPLLLLEDSDQVVQAVVLTAVHPEQDLPAVAVVLEDNFYNSIFRK